MRKILFVMFAALAFVACDKEEGKKYYLPQMEPQIISCLDNSGMSFEIKSDIPSKFKFVGYTYKDDDDSTTLSESMDTDLYNIIQLDEYTYKVTIKPFSKQVGIAFAFEAIDNPLFGRVSQSIVYCGFETNH